MAENASSSGVRPLTYVFRGGDRHRLCQQSIHPRKRDARRGRPDEPAVARSSRAGAQLLLARPCPRWRQYGPLLRAGRFDVFTPIVIKPPPLVSPAINAVCRLRPKFTFSNAARSGPVGAISYAIEVSDSDTSPISSASGTSPSRPARRRSTRRRISPSARSCSGTCARSTRRQWTVVGDPGVLDGAPPAPPPPAGAVVAAVATGRSPDRR